MERITIRHLRPVVDRINRETGSPSEPWTRGADGKLRANIGNYHLNSAYSGYQLVRMMNDGGGVTTVIHGYGTARETYEKMHAFLAGLRAKGEAA